MHEVSLAQNIFKRLESDFSREELRALTGIRLRIGELSNVEPLLMESAFDAVKKSTGKYTAVSLTIETIPVMAECEKCGEQFPVPDLHFQCSACGSSATHVISGFEMEISQLEFVEE